MSWRGEIAVIWAIWWSLLAVWSMTGEWRFGAATLLPFVYFLRGVIVGFRDRSGPAD